MVLASVILSRTSCGGVDGVKTLGCQRVREVTPEATSDVVTEAAAQVVWRTE